MCTKSSPVRVTRPLVSSLVVLMVCGGAVSAAGLRPEAVAGWQAYVAATERRQAAERGDQSRFLVMDFHTNGAEDRRAVLSGAVVTRRMVTTRADGRALAVPSAMVHHWRGAVFLAGTTVDALLKKIEYANPPAIQQDVLQSSVLSRMPGTVRVYLRLQRQKVVTVVYNTEHDVSFVRYAPDRAGSRSSATKIAEVANPGTSSERELPPGADRGFLWRLNAYWRYQDVPGGVVAECESISLSRDVPAVFSYVVGGLIESTARESMEATLSALRQRYGNA